jgi:hypothetical protein
MGSGKHVIRRCGELGRMQQRPGYSAAGAKPALSEMVGRGFKSVLYKTASGDAGGRRWRRGLFLWFVAVLAI